MPGKPHLAMYTLAGVEVAAAADTAVDTGPTLAGPETAAAAAAKAAAAVAATHTAAEASSTAAAVAALVAVVAAAAAAEDLRVVAAPNPADAALAAAAMARRCLFAAVVDEPQAHPGVQPLCPHHPGALSPSVRSR